MSEELKALTDLEINKAVFSIVTGGKGCWHEEVAPFKCSCGKDNFRSVSGVLNHLNLHKNPDYLNNKSDWADLIQFVVNEWEDDKLESFLLHYYLEKAAVSLGDMKGTRWQTNLVKLFKGLFKDQRALPEALASWKEGE